MKEIKVQIPDGEYCQDCRFLNYYVNELVDLFGNETGATERGYECKYYRCRLGTEQVNCCCEKVKKCFMCNNTLTDKIGDTGIALLMLMLLLGNKEVKEDNENKE